MEELKNELFGMRKQHNVLTTIRVSKQRELSNCKDQIAQNRSLLDYKEEQSNDGERLNEEIKKINKSNAYARRLGNLNFYKFIS